MRGWIIIIALMAGLQGYAQDFRADLKLIKTEVLEPEDVEETKEPFFKGILKFYSNHISDQIINDCIYEQSCSEFSQGCMHEYGLFKGTILTMDRMMRCNRLSQSSTLPVRFNELGKISDHWYSYGKQD